MKLIYKRSKLKIVKTKNTQSNYRKKKFFFLFFHIIDLIYLKFFKFFKSICHIEIKNNKENRLVTYVVYYSKSWGLFFFFFEKNEKKKVL